jgi:hypothetical protein
MHSAESYPCDFAKACHALWGVQVKGWTQTKTAIKVGLNVGTVSHVVRGNRFPTAFPIPLPGFDQLDE